MTSNSAHLIFVSGKVAADQAGIRAFALDATSGALTPGAAFAGISSPSFIAIHPSQRYLYAVSETSAGDGEPSGAVWALAITPGADDAPRLAAINQRSSGGDGPCHLTLDPSGRWLVVSNYSSGSVGVLPVAEDGSLGALSDFVQHRGGGPNRARQEGPHAHSATFTPDGRFIIVADLGIDRLLIYGFDPRAGTLSAHGEAAAPPGAGPRHVAFHPSGQILYVANELANSVGVYAYAPEKGTLRERQLIATVPADAPESTVADIHLGPNGDRLYVSNRGHESIAVFDLAADGSLALRATPSCGGSWPRNFAIAPGGRFLLVTNQRSDELTVLAVGEDGVPGAASARAQVANPTCVQLL